ncbi:hypothetical protein K504DRAFT_451285 [Pleomassaria siparia CBS 279.74]|uniref:Uncharacterized protein n=1 Tax=Pleomassaria siparia CBS 279.74 TaxID=1314801 RepID=A0A6G1JU75_9PLEO|nr:hypothetical protein K504DRAFT_451285 [Pleomassaria siparia CBS 279.74]
MRTKAKAAAKKQAKAAAKGKGTTCLIALNPNAKYDPLDNNVIPTNKDRNPINRDKYTLVADYSILREVFVFMPVMHDTTNGSRLSAVNAKKNPNFANLNNKDYLDKHFFIRKKYVSANLEEDVKPKKINSNKEIEQTEVNSVPDNIDVCKDAQVLDGDNKKEDVDANKQPT